MDLTVLVALVLATVVLLLFYAYRQLTSKYGYWEAQGIPTIKPRLFYGSTKDEFSKQLDVLEEERYKKYGRLYGTYEFRTRALNIADPELVRQVLVKDFHIFTNRRPINTGYPVIDSGLGLARDEQWKRIRSVVSPSFTSGKMRKMNCHFVEAAKGLIQNFEAAADAKDVLDVKAYFGSFSLDVIGFCAFGIRVESLKNPDHPFAVNTKKLFSRNQSLLNVLFYYFPPFSRLFGSYVLRDNGLGYFIDAAKQIIDTRKTEDGKVQQVDLIRLLLNAREGKDIEDDAEKELEPAGKGGKINNIWNISKTLSDTEVHAQACQFLFAGHDTAATALSCMAYELALNPDVQDRLHQEVVDTHKAHGEFNYDVVGKMPYLDAVIAESLRRHTIGVKVERYASEDCVLGSSGIKICKGDLVMVLCHAIHHDPEWYPDPYKFNPERFLPENRDSLTPYTYLAFGEGPRICMGQRFVLLEMKICMAMVLMKFKFVATDETRKPLEFFNSAGLHVPKKVMMTVEKREN